METKRPVHFTALCIAAFILGGVFIIVGIFSTIASKNYQIFSFLPVLENAGFGVQAFIGFAFSIIYLLLSIVAFIGIIQMWHMLKIGYWIYFFSHLLILILPFFLVRMPVQMLLKFMSPMIIFIPVFLILFGLNYRKLS